MDIRQMMSEVYSTKELDRLGVEWSRRSVASTTFINYGSPLPGMSAFLEITHFDRIVICLTLLVLLLVSMNIWNRYKTLYEKHLEQIKRNSLPKRSINLAGDHYSSFSSSNASVCYKKKKPTVTQMLLQ